MSFRRTVLEVLGKAYANPISAYAYGHALVKGLLYVAYCRIFTRRVRIGLPFLIFCKKVTIRGPGTVDIGSGCSVFANAFDRLTIVTLSPDAHVRIGDKCDLGGVTIRCRNSVVVGDNGLFANCLLQDTPFLTVRQDLPETPNNSFEASDQIRIGEHVWIAGQTVILCGGTVGKGSVLSTGSLMLNNAVPQNHLACGSPVVRSASIDSLAGFLRTQ
jgi:acetyltransferase-like isoleucine patch superfamily enzyme